MSGWLQRILLHTLFDVWLQHILLHSLFDAWLFSRRTSCYLPSCFIPHCSWFLPPLFLCIFPLFSQSLSFANWQEVDTKLCSVSWSTSWSIQLTYLRCLFKAFDKFIEHGKEHWLLAGCSIHMFIIEHACLVLHTLSLSPWRGILSQSRVSPNLHTG